MEGNKKTDKEDNKSLSKNNKQHRYYLLMIFLFTFIFAFFVYTKFFKPTNNNIIKQYSLLSDHSQQPQPPNDSSATSTIITHEHIGEKVPPLTDLPEGYSLEYRNQDRYIIDKDGRYELKLDPDWSPAVYGNTIYYFIGEYLAYEGGGGYFIVYSYMRGEKEVVIKKWVDLSLVEQCDSDGFCSYLSETFYVDDIEARIYVTGERMGNILDEVLMFYKDEVLFAFSAISVPKTELIKLIKNIKPLNN